MQTKAIDSKYPSVFTIATVFGGGVGMTTASLFGHNGGAGFLLGFGLVFLVLGMGVLVARHREILVNHIVTMVAWTTSEDLAFKPLLAERYLRTTHHSLLFRYFNFIDKGVAQALDSAISKFYRKPQPDNELQILNKKIATLEVYRSLTSGRPLSEEERQIFARMLRDILEELQKPESEN